MVNEGLMALALLCPLAAGAFPTGGYRTTTGIHNKISALAAIHSNIAEVIDYGDSYLKVQGAGGYDLKALKITNKAIPGPKPVFFLVANYHGNEIPGPEIAMRMIDWLLEGYGNKADPTWLVDYHEIWVVPTVNPDRRGISRENANGVDLNRNHDFKWAPAANHGAFPASEPEISYLQDIIAKTIPDQRGASDTDVAPPDTTGIYVSLHTPFGQVNYPWAWTSVSAPNAAELSAMASMFATYNRFTPQQSIKMYRMLGCGSDWAYGALGIPAFLIELAPTHSPEYSLIDAEIWPGNKGALIYAAKIARKPYRTIKGPNTLGLTRTYSKNTVTIRATIDDTTNGGQTIAAAECYIDIPHWDTGAATNLMAPSDGLFDSSSETVEKTIDMGALTSGRHTVFVRGKDSSGNAGVVSAIFIHTDP